MPNTAATPCEPAQLAAPGLISEAQRHAALHACDMMGSAPFAVREALVRLAAHTFHVPAASIWLRDADRLWFRAGVGLSDNAQARDKSLCAHTMAQSEALLVVEDLSLDTRFAPLPQGDLSPHWRFYAGAPLRNPQGLVLGTLAIWDTQSRAFSANDRLALKDLALLATHDIVTQQAIAQLQHLAMTDPLTGLANRTQFHHALGVEMAHAMRTGEPFSVLAMDLDGFRDVADGFGHAAGEEVLREVARRLHQQVRLGDVLSRFGGDEFGVVMRHGAKDSAQVLAKRILKAVSAPITLSTGDEIGVGISIGMAAYSDRVESVAVLLAQADQALYQAKKQNEKRWKMFVGIR
jgi:diguanylate cyclase (GGDEF)-like protein